MHFFKFILRFVLSMNLIRTGRKWNLLKRKQSKETPCKVKSKSSIKCTTATDCDEKDKAGRSDDKNSKDTKTCYKSRRCGCMDSVRKM